MIRTSPAWKKAAIRRGTSDTSITHRDVVKVLIATPVGTFLCSGTVVSPTRVLTAAHCLYQPLPGTTVSVVEGNGTVHSVSGYRVHPLYTSTLYQVSSPAIPNPGYALVANGPDLATVDVWSAFTFAPRPLATTPVPRGSSVTIVGYGQIANGILPADRRIGTASVVTSLPLVLNGQAAMRGGNFALVPGGGSASTIGCPGDSGSPAIDSSGRIVGVASQGAPNNAACESITNNTYVGTYDNVSWILQSGTPLPCHNYAFPADVNNDQVVTPLDALIVINARNAGTGLSTCSTTRYLDTNPDNALTDIDATKVIDILNR